MNKKNASVLALAAALGTLSQASLAADIALHDWGFNFDGTTYCLLEPSCDHTGVNPAAIPGLDSDMFNFDTGLGMLTATFTGVGSHSFVSFFDHEIDEAINTNFNETGSAVNETDLPAGQSWEIDEPGFGAGRDGSGGTPYFGDIFDNFLDDLLDKMVFYNAADAQFLVPPDDVSTALSWNFDLLPDEQGVVKLTVSESAPGSGFYLTQHDPASNASTYLSGSLSISPVDVVPAPATLALVGAGLIGFGGLSGRRRRKGV